MSEVQLPPTEEVVIDFDKVKSVGVLFNDAFVLYRKYFGTISIVALLVTVVLTSVHVLGVTVFDFKTIQDISEVQMDPFALVRYSVENLQQVLFLDVLSFGWIVNVIGFALLGGFMQYVVSWQYRRQEEQDMDLGIKYWISLILSSIALSALINVIFGMEDGWFFLLITFLLPALMVAIQAVFSEGKTLYPQYWGLGSLLVEVG